MSAKRNAATNGSNQFCGGNLLLYAPRCSSSGSDLVLTAAAEWRFASGQINILRQKLRNDDLHSPGMASTLSRAVHTHTHARTPRLAKNITHSNIPRRRRRRQRGRRRHAHSDDDTRRARFRVSGFAYEPPPVLVCEYIARAIS